VITVWFLIALIAFPGVSSINYKGYYAYHTKEECETQRISLENFIVDMELKRGKTTMFVDTYCLEMQAFPNQLEKYKEENQKGISLGGQQLGA
tara:strand:+ start:80 stop:358 length:279 start_codon:yes stop_codon:yes gene_type:complete